MKKIKNSTVLRWNLTMLTMVGMWPTTEKYSKLYGIYSIFAITLLPLLHNLLQIIDCFFIYNNIELLSQVLYIALIDILGIIKMTIIVKNMPLMKTIINSVDAEEFEPKTEEQQKILTKIMKFWKYAFNGFVTSSIATVMLWTAMPFLGNTYKKGDLLFLAWYPYNISVSPFYELTHAHQMLSTYFLTFTNMAVDGLVGGIMLFVGGQCVLLCDDLRNVSSFTKKKLKKQNLLNLNYEENSSKVLNKLNETLINCMQYHKQILSYADKANQLFGTIAVFQFAVSVIVMCMTAFRLTMVEPYSVDFYVYCTYGCAICAQLCQYCWFGNEVLLHSSEIPYAIYEIDWLEAPMELKKNLVFFMLCAQKPIVFQALNFFDLSLPTFISILKLSWSYFGLLRQMNTDAP